MAAAAAAAYPAARSLATPTSTHFRHKRWTTSGGRGRGSLGGTRRRARRVVVAAGIDEDEADTATTGRSSYRGSSTAVKGLVSGLTTIVNAIGALGGGADGSGTDAGTTRREQRAARPLPSVARSPAALRDGISAGPRTRCLTVCSLTRAHSPLPPDLLAGLITRPLSAHTSSVPVYPCTLAAPSPLVLHSFTLQLNLTV